MDQTSLQELARLLEPLKSGRWLQQQLSDYATSRPGSTCVAADLGPASVAGDLA